MRRSAVSAPLMTKADQQPQAAPRPAGLKRGWCLFEARRRCYVEGVILESPGQTLAVSAPAALRLKENMHVKLIAGEFPKTKEVNVLDINGHPALRNRTPIMRTVVEDDELLELDGDPIVGSVPEDFGDDQFAMRHALTHGKRAPGS